MPTAAPPEDLAKSYKANLAGKSDCAIQTAGSRASNRKQKATTAREAGRGKWSAICRGSAKLG